MQDATKTLLGSTESSDRLVTNENGDPVTFRAGLAVRRSSAGILSLSSGGLIGVSLGKSLDAALRTAVCRVGNRVPLRLTNAGVAASLVRASITFTAKAAGLEGNGISVAFIEGGTAGSEMVTVVGKAISVSMATGVSTTTQLKAALDGNAAAFALIGTVIVGTSAQNAFAVANLAGGTDVYTYAAIGAPVLISATTGLAEVSGAVTTGAIYLSNVLDGVAHGGTSAKVAMIDMGGGL